ncbi:hypothetical protein [Streptomyces sp. SID13726]|uniref:hypothetical protein n=1 Tax=Streptomyces sp. SID13726 TaxID=2706058 RepID=UPI0013B6FAC0|nr:hypothetical protein [Streptomyces sp. SID13726]NEB00606.1 hypothetical protein [Streptomyces sp. SID13726]
MTMRSLTERQRRCLALAASGQHHDAIAKTEYVTPQSVSRILSQAADALGTQGIPQTVAVALITGILNPADITGPHTTTADTYRYTDPDGDHLTAQLVTRRDRPALALRTARADRTTSTAVHIPLTDLPTVLTGIHRFAHTT